MSGTLRRAYLNGLPLLWFVGVAQGRYFGGPRRSHDWLTMPAQKERRSASLRWLA